MLTTGWSGTHYREGLIDASEEEHEVDTPDPQAIGDEAEFVDDAIDDDEVSVKEQLLLDRKELQELGLTLDNPEGFADDDL